MANMFLLTKFNQPIGEWNTSSVLNMSQMFSNNSNFNQPIGDWDTSKVTNMRSMFYGASAFNQPIGDWNVSNVSRTLMSAMFFEATSFNQNISSWCVEHMQSEPSSFNTSSGFENNEAFQPKWGEPCSQSTSTSTPLCPSDVFSPLTKTELQTALADWITSESDATTKYGDINNHTYLTYHKYGVTFTLVKQILGLQTPLNFNSDISNWDVSNVTNMSNMFTNAPYFNQPIGNWDVSSVTSMLAMFNHAYSFNHTIGNWKTQNVTNMNGMFVNAFSFNQDISSWCVQQISEKPWSF